MKLLLTGLISHLISAWPPSHTCQEIRVVTTTQQRDLLREYVADCFHKNFFFEGKGIITLTIYHDRKNRLCWQVQAFIDGRYQLAPPPQYSWFEHEIILVYPGTQDGSLISVHGNTSALKTCLAQYIGGRVYKYTKNPSYIIETISGKQVKTPVSVTSAGNGHNDLIFQFNEDGTVTKIIPM